MRFHVKDSESSYVILPQSSQAIYSSNINLGRVLPCWEKAMLGKEMILDTHSRLQVHLNQFQVIVQNN